MTREEAKKAVKAGMTEEEFDRARQIEEIKCWDDMTQDEIGLVAVYESFLFRKNVREMFESGATAEDVKGMSHALFLDYQICELAEELIDDYADYLEAQRYSILCSSAKFKYQLLGRMKADCEYYLGYGNRNIKDLWAHDEAEQIHFMLCLWDSFKKDEKPEWLTREQIIEYSRSMGNLEKVQ